MMESAEITISMRIMLRGESIMTALLTDSLCCKDGKQSPYERFYKKPSILNSAHFIQFDCIGYVTVIKRSMQTI
jgi:hypothetical protein